MNAIAIEQRRALIDRRSVADRLMALRSGTAIEEQAAAILAGALASGRSEIARRLMAQPAAGKAAAQATAYLHDQIVRLAYDLMSSRLLEAPLGEGVALVGLGGTGRGEMAPYSDLDLMLLTSVPQPAAIDSAAEKLFGLLWALNIKVGHSVRTVDEMIAAAKDDNTVRTALLEARWIWGDARLVEQALERFRREVVSGSAAQFVAAKLAERDARHVRMGDSRYVVEPNVKDGKGGLRDLNTLTWIGKYVHGVEQPADLVKAGLLTAAEYRRFDRAERFFWSVRCHLHLLAGRAEERLGFEHQQSIAEILRYADRPGKSAVERFMQFYFINARNVGDLTGLFLAQLDEQLGKKGFRFALPTIRRRPKRLAGFVLDRGRISIPGDDFFREDPVRLIELFAIAARERLEIHPLAMRSATREAKLIDRKVRQDERANALFLDVLTCRNSPETVLRWMNEAGVFGRFVPDFGRVVAQMQFDMYHHYTVDEHSIRAIGLLAQIERGELKSDHPLSTALFGQIASRRVLYVAVLLHDIAKGRGGDHSELGADIALKLGPRFGLDAAETETVAWLVRHHLLLSATAFKRDLADPKTIADFVAIVQSPERLRLLLILTVVDIRAVGPGIWTDWKRTLLRGLFEAAEERLRLGHKQHGRSELVNDRRGALARQLGWNARVASAHGRRLPDSYWLAEPLEWQVANARQIAESEARIGDPRPSVEISDDPVSGATRVSIFTPDRDGLFYRICAGLAGAGANILDARIHTTGDGMALDNLLIVNGRGQPYADRRLRARLDRALKDSLNSDVEPALPDVPRTARRLNAFSIAPSVAISDKASSRTTVAEVNAIDRPALLAALTAAIHALDHRIHSAHIATYGERAVDVFYLTGSDGKKLDAADSDGLRRALLEAASVAETQAR
ncbi:MAG: [protein-PII] uridylyltransferase [Pseudomonadota bacterium]